MYEISDDTWTRGNMCRRLYTNQVTKEEKHILQEGNYDLNWKYIKCAESITLPCLKEILEEVYKITKDNEIPLCFIEDSER